MQIVFASRYYQENVAIISRMHSRFNYKFNSLKITKICKQIEPNYPLPKWVNFSNCASNFSPKLLIFATEAFPTLL
jgi:hypothetical protein